MKTATTEAVALFKLSDLCYRRGDLKNAYTFINQAQAGAAYYDSRGCGRCRWAASSP
ncbi:MAG: hypothetical protein WKG07_05710 [Hymenobacter sp.]